MIYPIIIDLPKEFNSYTSIQKEKEEKDFFELKSENGRFGLLEFNERFSNFTNLRKIDSEEILEFDETVNFMFEKLDFQIPFISNKKFKIRAKIKKISKSIPNPVIE